MDNGGNCNKNHLSWDLWEVGSSRFDWNGLPSSSSSSSSVSSLPPTTTSTKITTSFSDLGSLHFNNFPSNRPTSPSEIHPFLLHNPTLFKPQQQRQQNHYRYHHQEEAQEATRAHFMLPHSHFFSNNSADSLTCLKLGKRQYFEDSLEPTTDPHLSGFSMGKKNRQASPISIGGAAAVAIPRCQVEGCNVGLLNAKEYHKRHKVCEMHSKAPRVVVLGLEQRFCQQCSRFHLVSEFDDSKRSCRRRLAGHNERRRKNSSDSINRNHSQVENKIGDRYLLPCATPSAARALSLLSTKTASWVSQADLSVRSSAALRELIAENRAAILAKQLLSDRGLHGLDDSSLNFSHVQQQLQLPGFHSHESVSHMCSGISLRPTLDLMQTANLSFPILSTSRSKEDDEEREIWKSLEGTHIV